MRTLAMLVLFAVVAGGCGYKGPLYLPPPGKPAATPPAAAKPAPPEIPAK